MCKSRLGAARGARRSLQTPRGLALGLALLLVAGSAGGAAATEAEAAQKPPIRIQLLTSTRTDACFEPGYARAIKKLARQERERINAQGGIAGRRLDLEILDDEREDQRAVANVRSAIEDPRTLAVIGLSSSERAKAVFDALGAEIKSSQVPFLSDISISSIFAAYPNVFTTRASQDDERIPVLIQFAKHIGATRPAFVGIKGNLFSATLADGLKRSLGETPLAADHRLSQSEGKLDGAEIEAVAADLKEKNPDLIFLTVGSRRSAEIMKAIAAAGVTPPLFITGRIESIPDEAVTAYPSDLYQVAWGDLPDVYNDRLRQAISLTAPEAWDFGGDKNASAPGWASGECKEQDIDAGLLSSRNLRAIRIGGQYADMIGLVAAAARTAAPAADVEKLRAHVIKQLKTGFAVGRGTYKGSFENWSFRGGTRAAARTPLIVQRVPGLGRTQLAPVQFLRLRNETLRPVNTLYLDIDLIRTFNIDDNEKSFFAEFYLSMHGDAKSASIDQLDFANAFLDPKTNDRHLTIRVLNEGGKSEAYPDDVKIYQVAGRFMFDPKLANYPFDTQRFTIDIRPRRGDAPFIIQPPPAGLRDFGVVSDGWEPGEQYVGYDEDFVQTTDAKDHTRSVVPFYKASFVWQMTRQTTDYYLRVVVPLCFILMVAYLSIFIPRAHFEAIVTIQVTALLSSVALYLALPKIDADATTLSDRIFLFIYMAVSIMIAISILRINPYIANRPWLRTLLGAIYILAIPAMGILMAIYVHGASHTAA